MKKDTFKGSKKMIAMVISAVSFLFVGTAFLVMFANRVFNKQTKVTIQISGERNEETSDAFFQDEEHVKGDTMLIGDVEMKIENIKRDGTVTFHVESGELKDENGEIIESGTLTYDKKEKYYMKNGTVQLHVIRKQTK